MTEDGAPDALNTRPSPWRRRGAKGLGIAALIVGGVVAGAKLWQPVRTVEQRVTTPIREVVNRTSPLQQLPDYAAAACPAIVSLRLPGTAGPAPQAVLLSGEGLAVTTAPLPKDGAFEAWIDGRHQKATVQAQDSLTGIALLKLDGADLPSIALADPDLAAPGAWGFTLASPNGTGCIVEQAIVASDFATDGSASDYYLRIHGSGAPPPDGTPFLSPDGRVVALAQASIGPAGRQDRYLPADLVGLVVSRLMRTGDAATNGFGFIAEDLSPVLAGRLGQERGRGAVIVRVAEGSIAQSSGLRIGDVVLSAAHRPVSSASELSRLLGGDDPIELIVSRGRDKAQLTFTLTSKKPDTKD